jgi:hypothetical protein
LLHELAEAADDGQRVVDLVGHARRQLADGRQLRRLYELRLRALELVELRAELAVEARVAQRDGRLAGQRLE